MNFRRNTAALCLAALAFFGMAAAVESSDAGAPFGNLPLVQEIDCGIENQELMFTDYPKGISSVGNILGKQCRTLPNSEGGVKYFAYRIGKGANLKPGGAYLLSVEFPDDRPRSMFICNWGCETARGIHSGPAIGDAIKGRYTNNNPESLNLPLSGKFMQWRQFFFLHDRFPDLKRLRGPGLRPLLPADGFWVIIAQLASENNLESAGAAVSKIRLFEVPDPSLFHQKINYPPDGLPRRHLFCREEMADGVVAQGHKPEEKAPELRGVANPVDWYEYKIGLMKFLGMNTFAKDLLEFGHNQGWDSSKYGGNAWYNQSPTPGLWADIVSMLSRHPEFYVLPYYEYGGSIGQDMKVSIGRQRRCETLAGGKDYTHITWCHKTNADLADPDFIEDFRKVLDITVLEHKDKVKFIGVWLRPRPELNPVSFNDKDLEIFSEAAKLGRKATREELKSDKSLLNQYYGWWFKKRRDFNLAAAALLRREVNPNAVVLYTTDASEPGISLSPSVVGRSMGKPSDWKSVVVNDNPPKWESLLSGSGTLKGMKSFPYEKVLGDDMYLQSLLAPRGTWGNWEWQNACPGNDPENYTADEGILLSYSFNRLYTVSSEKAFDTFRTNSGLAVVRHYALNENEMVDGKDNVLGYFVADVERAGPFCMMGEARAMAFGDPCYIGYLAGNNFSRGFPEYVRDFNAAFLSLPALPSRILKGASSDPEVVVREIPTEKHGIYLAVVNTGFDHKNGVAVKLPAEGKLVDVCSGKEVDAKGGRIELSLYPGRLMTFNLK